MQNCSSSVLDTLCCQFRARSTKFLKERTNWLLINDYELVVVGGVLLSDVLRMCFGLVVFYFRMCFGLTRCRRPGRTKHEVPRGSGKSENIQNLSSVAIRIDTHASEYQMRVCQTPNSQSNRVRPKLASRCSNSICVPPFLLRTLWHG